MLSIFIVQNGIKPKVMEILESTIIFDKTHDKRGYS